LDGAKKLDPNAKAVHIPGKHRYLMPLDKKMSDKIAPLAKPYPKRVKQAMTGDQPEQRRRDTDLPAPLHQKSGISFDSMTNTLTQ
jgi:hypothetical protein